MPPSFWDLKESIEREQASLEKLFQGVAGFNRNRRDTPEYLAKLAEVAGFVAQVYDGRISPVRLVEAMSTSDFTYLFGDVLERQLLADYEAYPVTWPRYAARGTVRDFREARRMTADGLDGSYHPTYTRAEHETVKEDNSLEEGNYTTQVDVYEKKFAYSWRMFINDDLGVLKTIPTKLANGARRTEERYAATLFVDASGPHASLYTAGNGNIVTSNPALSIAGLQTAWGILRGQTDANGEPVVIEAVELVVPPALEVTAMNILNALHIEIDPNPSAGTEKQVLRAENWLKAKVGLSVNPYIPLIASTANGDTSWWLFASPQNGRPAVEVTFLRGWEQPSIWEKMSDMRRLGGAVDPMMGSFESGEKSMKGLHIIGGCQLDPLMTVGSNGSGS